MKKKPTVKRLLTEFLGLMDQSPGKNDRDSADIARICLKSILHDQESLRREKKALETMLRNQK